MVRESCVGVSSLRSGRDCKWGGSEKWKCSLPPSIPRSNTTTEVRPLIKAPNSQLLPGRYSISCPLLRVCGCVCVCVCVYLDGLYTEHKFQVWVTILGLTSLHFIYCVAFDTSRLFRLFVCPNQRSVLKFAGVVTSV